MWTLHLKRLPIAACLLAAAFGARADAFELIFDVNKLSPEESAAFDKFAEYVKDALPQSAVAAIDRPIYIRFADLDGRSEFGDLCRTQEDAENPNHPDYGKPQHEWGNFSSIPQGWRIEVNQLFRQEIVKGPEASIQFECKHKSVYKMAMATVVHEIGHILDRSGRYSNSGQYLALMDWSSGLFSPSQKNALKFLSPDAYEQADPSENFAVNFEYFLLDPAFGCRRPSVWHYMAEQFHYSPSPVDCAPYREIFLSPSGPFDEIDPGQVVEVRFLLAAKGKETASRWGHAMFQLVMCGPDGGTLKDCRRRPSQHIVIGYRANVMDATSGDWSGKWKGLTGGYPSQIFFYLFSDIIREYAEGEFRDVISLPLKLTAEQRRMFVNRALEQYWSYKGRYYFLTNNCATEANDALRGTVDSGHKFQKSRSLSPIGLYDALVNSGLIDPSVLKFRDEAITGGYLYPSRRKILEDAFAKIAPYVQERWEAGSAGRLSAANGDPAARDQMFSAGPPTLEAFLEDSTPAERLSFFQPGKREQTAALLALERHINHVRQGRLAGRMIAMIQDESQWPKGEQQEFKEAVEQMEKLQPWNQIAAAGYGIPDSGASALLRQAETLSADLAQAAAGKAGSSASELRPGIERAAENFRTAVDDQERLGWAAVVSAMAGRAIPGPEVVSRAQIRQYTLGFQSLGRKLMKKVQPEQFNEIRASDSNISKFKKALKKERADTDLIAGPDITMIHNAVYEEKMP